LLTIIVVCNVSCMILSDMTTINCVINLLTVSSGYSIICWCGASRKSGGVAEKQWIAAEWSGRSRSGATLIGWSMEWLFCCSRSAHMLCSPVNLLAARWLHQNFWLT